MKKLFIIGNGFDIQHGIKSKYSDFHAFMRSIYMNEEIRDDSFNDFFPWRYSVPESRGVLGKFDDSELINVFGFLDYCITKSENKEANFNFYVNSDWSLIESTLANLDLREFFQKDFPSSHTSEEDKAYDIAECFKYLYKIFWVWVKEINIDFVVPIDAFEKLFDCENDIFFTFNYTRTLEEIYGAKQVRHVHGEQGKGLLFGHKKLTDINEYCIKNNIPAYCSHAIKVLMEITEKDTEKNSSNMALYYLFLDKDITDIYSYGFSFSEVDLPYIRGICKSIDTSKIVWHLSDFDSKEKRDEYKNILISCGFRGEFAIFSIANKKRHPFTLKRQNNSDYNLYLKMQKKYMGRSRFALHKFLLDYNTVGYVRPTQQWKQSGWTMIPRLFWVFILFVFDFIVEKVLHSNGNKAVGQ